MKHTTLLIMVLLVGYVSAAKYEEGVYFKPTGNMGYVLGEDQYMDSITVLGGNLLFTNLTIGTDVLYYGVTATAGNITLDIINQSYINHTCTLQASVAFTVTGLNWTKDTWYIYNVTDEIIASDDTAPLDFSLAQTVDYAYYMPGDSTTTTTVPGATTTTTSTTVSTTTTTGTATTTTTLATVRPPNEQPCFAHIKNGRILRGVLCVYERAFGGERT